MRTPAEERYQRDPVFHQIVDLLRSLLEGGNQIAGKSYTATELREAVMLAAELYEYQHIRPLLIFKKNGDLYPAMFGSDPTRSGDGDGNCAHCIPGVPCPCGKGWKG